MHYLVVPPPDELAPYVKYFGAYRMDHIPPNLQISTLVNDASGIVIQHRDGRSAMRESGQFIPVSMLYGMSTASRTNLPVSGFSAVAAVFHPYGIYELFGIDASELTDQEIFLDEFAGWSITDFIINTPDLRQQVNILIDFLRARLKYTNGTDLLVKDSILKIQQSKGILNVRDLVSYYKISERQLQRRYKQTIGVSPRHYVKITRFREAMSLFKHPGFTLTEIAHKLDYTDQAHFIRHTRELSGLSPKELRKRMIENDVNQNMGSPYVMGVNEKSG